jgi:uncharacterized protein YbcI
MPEQSDKPQDPRPRREGDPGPPSGKQVTDAIAREILRIHTESYGRGARSAAAEVVGDFVVVILDDLKLLPNEELLVEHGNQDAVTEVRHQYQAAIQAPFRAAVERATGRKVISFDSTTSVDDPPYMVGIFRLE